MRSSARDSPASSSLYATTVVVTAPPSSPPASGWRLTFVIGETAAYLPGPGADFTESEAALAGDTAERLASAGGVLADLFPTGQETAA